ncbi:MAG TPA: GNAT family N-acetyltransferase [Acidimicrobiales bacterium]|nr:GNAT family N-acetyltransferase [Acidimicrobiales bacterium]
MAESSFRVRQVERADWAALRAIRLEALSDSPEAFGSTLSDTQVLTARQWKAKIATLLYFLVERDGQVVGMVSGGFNDNRPGTHWLYGMYVTRSARGTEAANLLVRAVLEWAQGEGASEVYLHVAAAAPRARTFYRKVGFRETGEIFAMERDLRVTMFTMVKDVADEFRIERVEAPRLHDLRRRVLRNNDPRASVDEPRDHDPDSRHYAGLLGERVVASASFYPSPAPVRSELLSYQLRFMAVDADEQGHGYGARLLGAAEDSLRAIGVAQLWANARDTALGFYEATGWTIVPDSAHLSAATNLPHHQITKIL